MEPSSYKFYHVHGFHSGDFLDKYFCNKPEMPFGHESLRYPMEKFHDAFSTGHFKGDILIDISLGPAIHHLYSALGYFRNIILLRSSDHCILEVKKWQNSRTGAFDWSHTSALANEIAEKSDQCENKEILLRTTITQVVKFDLNQENLTDPLVLPQADCLVLGCSLEVISKDFEDFVKNLRKFSKYLKAGGHLLFYGMLNGTFFEVGGDRFHVVKYNESNLRTALSSEGFVISHLEVTQRRAETNLCDFQSMVFCTAYKGNTI
ncbi:nicotinamide N-methyltransferase-like [Pyxicephalus adspersus]|uniref:nicotinamide N-methyltransferase-like n=1 Tax=Pyxicephalus adspersus TaxID=30357 RepID=UPI003B5AE634